MTEKVNALPLTEFVAAWNGADTLEQAAERVRVGTPAPRWAVPARALTCRKEGLPLKVLAGEPGLR